MAKRCGECGESYPETKKKCPHCGAVTAVVEADDDEVIVAEDAEEEDVVVAEALPPSEEIVALEEDEEPPTPKAKGRAKTMLAEPQEADEEDEPVASSKKTKLGGKAKPKTMLAEPEEIEEAEEAPLKSPKKTQMAAQAKPKTKLAEPEEIEEEIGGGEEESLKKTKLAGKSKPKTMVASQEEEADVVEAIEADEVVAAEEDVDISAHEAAHGESEVNLAEASHHELDLGELFESMDDKEKADAEGPSSDVMSEAMMEEDEEAAPKSSESSAVDLGSSGDIEIPELGEPTNKRAKSTAEIDMEDMAAEALAGADDDATVAYEEGIAEGTEEAVEEEASAEETLPDDEVAADAEEEVMAAESEVSGGKKKGRLMPMLAGTFLGAILGTAACGGAWYFGIEPPQEWRPDQKKTQGSTNPGTGSPKPAVEEKPLEVARTQIALGNFEEGVKKLETLPKPQDPKDVSAQLAEIGAARWLSYLSKQSKPNAADEPVKKAIDELKQAGNADGLFWLGQIHERMGNIPEAVNTYKQGMTKDPKQERKFQAALERLETRPDAKVSDDKPEEISPPKEPAEEKKPTDKKEEKKTEDKKPADDKATDKKEDKKPEDKKPADKKEDKKPAEDKPADKEKEVRAGHSEIEVYLFGLAYVVGQNPPADQLPPPSIKEPDEAGYSFWKAVKAAKRNNYAEAIKALQEARKAHDQRRFLRPLKPQNPDSDPTEEIFLRTCDELLAYWQLRAKLTSEGLLGEEGKQSDPLKAVDGILKAKKDAEGVVEAAVTKLKDVAPKAKNIGEGIDELLKAKKLSDEQVKALVAPLEEAKYVTEEQKDAAKGLLKLIKDQKDSAKTLADAVELLKTEKALSDTEASVPKGIEKLRDAKKAVEKTAEELTNKLKASDGLISDVSKKLEEAKYLPEKAPRTELVKGLDKVIVEASSPVVKAVARVVADVGGTAGTLAGWVARNYEVASQLALSQSQVARYEFLINQTRTPQQMLDLWMLLLQDNVRPNLVEKAVHDAQVTGKDKAADAEAKAQARAVEGLALRNQGKLVEARKVLQEALATKTKGEWRALVEGAAKELTDPTIYFLPQTRKAFAAGKLDDALIVIQSGLDLFPANSKEGAQLLALRSQVNLEKALAAAKDNKLPAAAVAEAAQDADQAKKAGAVTEGYFAEGRIAEVTGNLPKAKQSYQQALEAKPDGAQDASRYRVALARILVKEFESKPKPEYKPTVEDPAPTEEKKPEKKPAEEKKPEKKPTEKKPTDDTPEEKPAKPPEKKPAEEKKPAKPPEKKPTDDTPEEKPAKPTEEKKPEKKPAEKKQAEDNPEEKPTDKKPTDKKPEDKKPEEKKPEKKPADEDKQSRRPWFPQMRASLVALLLTAVVEEEEEKKIPAELKEAEKLADEAIKAGNPEGHFVKARSLAQRGLWNEAMTEYVQGLEKISGKSEQIKGLRYYVDNHPAFRMPTAFKTPDPLMAEDLYAAGLRLYWEKKYRSAEKKFFEAGKYNDQDARYMYFLGLTRLAQKKRDDAYEAFRRGAELEQQSKPHSGVVSATLERIQGADRQTLNSFRP